MDKWSESQQNRTECCGEEGQRNQLLPLVSSCGFDDTELAILDALRHFCCGFSVKDYDGTRSAWERLCQVWGPSDSAMVLSGLREFMTVLRKTRSQPFEFIGPFCPQCSRRICKSELEVMLLLREARSPDPGRVLTAAQYVVGRGKANDMVLEAVRLSETMSVSMRTYEPPAQEKVAVH